MTKRAELLKAMDIVARHINDENIVMSWLMGGVPDGTKGEEYEEYTDCMEDIVDCFMRCMKRAQKDGLYYR